MSKLFWQLPWAGPNVLEGGAPVWSVMPSPGLGNAQALCVPVKVSADKVLLALANAADLRPLRAPLGQWTVVLGLAGRDHDGYLCLLGYDQSRHGSLQTFVSPVAPEAPSTDELEQALAELQDQHGEWLLRQIFAQAPDLDPPVAPARPRPAHAAGPVPAPASRPPPAAAAPVELTIAFASCQYPSGLMDDLPAQASLQRLADLLDQPGGRRPQRLLLLGDQIYADATAGLLDPMRLDDRYRVPYEELLHMEPLRQIMARIPVLCMLDDHEIADNWEPLGPTPQEPLFDRAIRAYWTYQRGMKPQHRTWMRRPGNGWSLFVADTRTHRDPRCEATLATAEILGPEQREELEWWLTHQPEDNLKLIASPAMLLPRLVEHLDEPLHLDGWQGYPASLERLLMLVCDEKVRNLVFLSGDAHLGCDVAVTLTHPDGHQVTTRSIHAPALYAPLPFANEQPWNLRIPDHFRFPGPKGDYWCEVSQGVTFPRGDGLCLLECDRDEALNWKLTARVV